jgi:hypothetical protein
VIQACSSTGRGGKLVGAQAKGEELRELGEGEWEGVHSEDSRERVGRERDEGMGVVGCPVGKGRVVRDLRYLHNMNIRGSMYVREFPIRGGNVYLADSWSNNSLWG